MMRHIFIAVVAWALLVAASLSEAVQLDERGCGIYAVWSANVVWAREVGADKDKVRASVVAENDAEPNPALHLVLRDFEILWATSAPWKMVMMLIHRECFSRRGNYGVAS